MGAETAETATTETGTTETATTATATTATAETTTTATAETATTSQPNAEAAPQRSRSRSRSPLPRTNGKCHAEFPKGSAVQFFHYADPLAKHAQHLTPTQAQGRGPRLLQSHGWLDGTLDEDFFPEKYENMKRDSWPIVTPLSSLYFTDRVSGKAGTVCVAGKRIQMKHMRKPVAEKPALSLVFVRWGGDDEVTGPNENEPNDGDWGQYGCPACDEYMSNVISKGLQKHPALMGAREEKPLFDFEVFNLYLKSSADALAVEGMVHWVRSCLKGEKITAFWMMWPAEWEDCKGSDYAAYIQRPLLFQAMRACESVGLRTGFPHPADQYELITSKSWMATLSLHAQPRLPAATLVTKANLLDNPKAAAQNALNALAYIRQQNPFQVDHEGRRGPSEVNKDGITKGVVKLGFSWEARYVSIFKDEDDLAVKMTDMMTQPGCIASSCIVQEWVDFDFEMRLYFLPPASWKPTEKLEPTRIECNSWSGSMEEGSRRSFHKLKDEAITRSYWPDDDKALENAKAEATRISQYLLGWLRLSEARPVPMIRLDFMLLRLGPGKVQVTFGEYCEMGACCLGWQDGPPTIWRAALDSALR